MSDQPRGAAASWHRDIVVSDGVEQILDRIAERAAAELAVGLAVASLRPLRDGSVLSRARSGGQLMPVADPPTPAPGSEASSVLLPTRAWWPAESGGFPDGLIVDLSGDTGRRAPGDRSLLRLFAGTAGFFLPRRIIAATSFGAYASLSLLAVERLTHLWTALETRAVISQAQGVLMERYGVEAEAAMELLRRWSQESHRQVRSLALEITVHGPPPPTEESAERRPWTR